jgi:RsiW-degrading membrane proteinase PrsW (M82 family)
LLEQILYFLSEHLWANAGVLGWGFTFLAWGLAIVFGIVWLACYRPPLLSRPWLWVVLAGGAIAAPIAIIITSFPLGYGVSRLLNYLLNPGAIGNWGWLLSIPSIFIFGLVWEGAKLVPVTIYWWRKNRDIDPKLGLLIGAVAGAGFGMILAQWTMKYFIYDNNWSWQLVRVEGFQGIGGFWESFFVLGLNVGSTALAGWGLAKGWGWKFYLLAAAVYLVTNYNTVLASYEIVEPTQVQFIIAAWALIVVGVTLWLRERKPKPLPNKVGTIHKKSGSPRKK